MGDTDHHTSDDGVQQAGRDGRLTRRDAIASLTAVGVAAVAGCSSLLGNDDADPPDEELGDPRTDEDHDLETVQALATVLYPSGIEVTEEFLRTYLYSRIVDEDAYETELRAAVEVLDGLAADRHDASFRSLDAEQQTTVIADSELRSGDSVEDGSDVERVNYHLVDELLFAFYASPTGGELVGNRNPRGFPGGYGYSPPLER